MTDEATWDDFDTAAALVQGAATPEDLFGPAEPTRRVDARTEYRRLARICHPDHHGAARRPTADVAFAKLSRLWRAWLAATDPGTGTGTDPAAIAVLTTRRHRWAVGRLLRRDELCDVHAGHDLDGPDPMVEVVVKIPRRLGDADLIANEARVLARLADGVDPRWRPYFPTLIESFRHLQPDHGERRINVLEPLEGFRSLAEVRDAHPRGLDPRDGAWMWRRLLVALGAAHRAGVVHGAVLPDHVLVHPDDHGVVLADWTYAACEPGERVRAVEARYRDWFPPEVLGRRPAVPATDVYLASRTMAALLGDLAPKPLRSFLAGCTLPNPSRRPPDAWALLAELDDLLERLYGPRRFRPFHLPGPAAA